MFIDRLGVTSRINSWSTGRSHEILCVWAHTYTHKETILLEIRMYFNKPSLPFHTMYEICCFIFPVRIYLVIEEIGESNVQLIFNYLKLFNNIHYMISWRHTDRNFFKKTVWNGFIFCLAVQLHCILILAICILFISWNSMLGMIISIKMCYAIVHNV
jgi:hypothetical protein